MLKRFLVKFFLVTLPIGAAFVLLIEFGKMYLVSIGVQIHPLIPLFIGILGLIVIGRLTVGVEIDALNKGKK